jgi:mannose-1-phosphate guanylyltransferase/mannose-6-phosphate isomerase
MPTLKGAVSPFILCGGMGKRLWPLSRESIPKQFHRIAGPETLFQQTCRRLSGELFGSLSVLSNQKHRFLIADQLQQAGLDAKNIVLEPASRNTAPAACIAALMAARDDPEALALLVPSDHVISDAGRFAKSVASGMDAAAGGALVTFGVKPDRPHTGYGYIEVSETNRPDLPVRRFVEKPSRDVAEKYIASGNFFWNVGVFLFRSGTMVELMQAYAPEILKACREALDESIEDLDFLRLGAAYADASAISLDYAIAEKASTLRCIPLDTGWSDVGSWSEIWSLMQKDEAGNVAQGAGEVLFGETRDSYAYSNHGCVALVGLESVVVVVTEDAVLVASKDEAESVKTVVEQLKGNGRAQVVSHSRVHRPWGWYQTVNKGNRHQVKCIMVKPGGTLSLQSHHHRSEHWVVVEGTLEVTKGEDVELLSENQSTYIPIGKPHRLANPGKIPAFLIEVQSGSYLDEDDIVRYEDIYGRRTDD